MSRRVTKVLLPVGVLLVAAAVALAVLQPWSSVAETPDDAEKPVTATAEVAAVRRAVVIVISESRRG